MSEDIVVMKQRKNSRASARPLLDDSCTSTSLKVHQPKIEKNKRCSSQIREEKNRHRL